jgi:hypothetical protein
MCERCERTNEVLREILDDPTLLGLHIDEPEPDCIMCRVRVALVAALATPDAPTFREPRYDAIFFEGLARLNAMANGEITDPLVDVVNPADDPKADLQSMGAPAAPRVGTEEPQPRRLRDVLDRHGIKVDPSSSEVDRMTGKRLGPEEPPKNRHGEELGSSGYLVVIPDGSEPKREEE